MVPPLVSPTNSSSQESQEYSSKAIRQPIVGITPSILATMFSTYFESVRWSLEKLCDIAEFWPFGRSVRLKSHTTGG